MVWLGNNSGIWYGWVFGMIDIVWIMDGYGSYVVNCPIDDLCYSYLDFCVDQPR